MEDMEIHMTVVGIKGVGKSSLLEKYVYGECAEREYRPTVKDTVNFVHQMNHRANSVDVDVDVDVDEMSLENGVDFLNTIFLANTHCIILCYSVVDIYSVERIAHSLLPLLKKDSKTRDIPIILCGTKKDLVDATHCQTDNYVSVSKVEEMFPSDVEVIEVSIKEDADRPVDYNADIAYLFEESIRLGLGYCQGE